VLFTIDEKVIMYTKLERIGDEGTVPEFNWKDWGKPWKYSAAQGKPHTRHLQNKNSTSLLGWTWSNCPIFPYFPL